MFSYRNLFLLLAVMFAATFLTAAQTSSVAVPAHNYTASYDVPPVDDPTTPGVVENEVTMPDGTVVKNDGKKKSDPVVHVKHCQGHEGPPPHTAHTDVDANGAGNACQVTVAGNGANVTVDAGKGLKAGARTDITGQSNTVTLKGNKNCFADGGKGNTVSVGSGTGNHSHSAPLPPPHG